MAITASVTKGFTFATGVSLTPANMNLLGTPAVTVATPISIANGGTNATSASAARTALGLGSMAVQDADDVAITGGSIIMTPIILATYNVAGLPTPDTEGEIAYVTDGDGGSPCIAVWSASAWKRIALGAACSA